MLTIFAFLLLLTCISTCARALWSITERLEPPRRRDGEYFGLTVSIYDKWLAISAAGAPDGSKPPVVPPLVYVYNFEGERWRWKRRIGATEGDPALVVGPNVLLVCSPLASSSTGSVYVYDLSDRGVNAFQNITANDGSPDDKFGWSISLRNNVAVIGAIDRDEKAGAVYSFDRNGEIGAGPRQFGQTQQLVPSDAHASDRFGASVALSQDASTLVVGAWGTDLDDLERSGSAYVFKRISGTWKQEVKLVPSTSRAYACAGCGVAVVDAVVFISTFSDSDKCSGGASQLYAFSANSSGAWSETPVANILGLTGSLAADGNNVLVGSRVGAHLINRFGVVLENISTEGDAYVSVHGRFAVVGAPKPDNGVVFVYDKGGDGSIVRQPTPLPTPHPTILTASTLPPPTAPSPSTASTTTTSSSRDELLDTRPTASPEDSTTLYVVVGVAAAALICCLLLLGGAVLLMRKRSQRQKAADARLRRRDQPPARHRSSGGSRRQSTHMRQVPVYDHVPPIPTNHYQKGDLLLDNGYASGDAILRRAIDANHGYEVVPMQR